MKTKTCDLKYPLAEAKVSAAVDKRAAEANREYLTRARKLDAELGTPAETKEPFEAELRSYGKDGKVIIPVVGAFGEMSSDVYAIIDLVASMLTHEHLSYYSEHPAAIKGMFQQSIFRPPLCLSAHQRWARLAIDRTKEKADQVTRRPVEQYRPQRRRKSIRARIYFNPDPGFSTAAGHTAKN